MSNQILGILTVIICAANYALALKYFRKGRDIPAIILIMLCGLLLRLFTGADLYLHEWDERFHALVAKNLMQHPLVPTLYDNPLLPYDFRNWTENHIWVHKQPLPLWAMALSMKLFGINEMALRLPSILLSTAAICLTFYIGSALFNRKVGMTASFFHSINGFIIATTVGRTGTDHDMFHMFFVELSVFFIVYSLQYRKRSINVLIGLSIGLAILCKWLTALIVLPLWFILFRKNEPPVNLFVNFLIISAVCVVTFMPWQIYIHRAFPAESKWEDSYNTKHITEALEDHAGSAFFEFENMNKNYGKLIYIPLVWFLIVVLRNLKDERLVVVSVWFVVPVLFFTMVKTKMSGYTLFSAPSVFIILALFVDYALKKAGDIKGYGQTAAASFIVLIFLVPAVFFNTYSTLRVVRPFNRENREPVWAGHLKNLDQIINQKNTVIFNSDHPIETMFYSSFTAYRGLPTSEQIKYLTRRGYKIEVFCPRSPLRGTGCI
ncbi:MAG: glycosyltransferase family 39 protein [Nitrospirae bacterium]|nr:glycosyltransferase family 39 protein [Nitrospirota bacterium]